MQISKEEFNKRFYLCFSPALNRFLENRGLKYIVKAKEKKEGNIYELYEKTPALQAALDEWSVAKEEWRQKWFY